MTSSVEELTEKNTAWELAVAVKMLRERCERHTELLHEVQKIARNRTAEARGRRDHLVRLKRELRELHEPFYIYPVVWPLGRESADTCNHCGDSIEETYGDTHVEDSMGSQYTLCLTNGPGEIVCSECHEEGGDNVDFPCRTLRIFGVYE